MLQQYLRRIHKTNSVSDASERSFYPDLKKMVEDFKRACSELRTVLLNKAKRTVLLFLSFKPLNHIIMKSKIMKSKKNFLFLLLLFAFPEVCKADVFVGFWRYNTLIVLFVAICGIWAIEADVINSFFKKSYSKAFFASFIINIITSLLGFILSLAVYAGFFYSLILSFLIEGILLSLFYKEEKLKNLFKISLKMNLYSYSFFFGYMLLLSMPFILFTYPPSVVVLIYFFKRFYDSLAINSINKNKAKILFVAIFILIASYILLQFAVTQYKIDESGREKHKILNNIDD